MSGKLSYTVHIKRSAEKEMDCLPAEVFDRLSEKILKLELEPRPRGVEIMAVGHRREVYRGI